MSVTLSTITNEQREAFLNLYNLYLYDLSSFTGEDIMADGKFDPTNTYLYVEREELHPFFIRQQDRIVGFVLVCSPPFVPAGIDYTIQELFLLKKYRGSNAAFEAVSLVLQHFRGKIQVAQLKNNERAVRFWKKFYQDQRILFVEEEEMIELDGLPGLHAMISQTFDWSR